jgi:general secretion pathway protein K
MHLQNIPVERTPPDEALRRPAGRNAALGADGFILVAVLFILAALAALVGVFAIYAGNTAVSLRVSEDRLQTEALINAALELTAYRLVGLDDASRPSSGAFSFRLGRSNVAVEFRTERARIDLNLAPKALLSGLFTTLGAKQDDADFAADRIIGWRKTNDAPGQKAEADRYKTAGLKYAPRQAAFEHVAELKFVLGVPPALAERALPFVTVFNGRAEIDVNEAAPEVIAALPHMTPDRVAAILRQRNPQDMQAVRGLLGEAVANVAVGGRGAVRAAIHLTLASGRRVNADVVILVKDSGPDPYRILAWRDDFDGDF